MFIFFVYLYTPQVSARLRGGTKKSALFLRVQRKRTKKRAADHSPFHCWPAFGGLPCVYTPLRGAARLREMANLKNVFSVFCMLF